MDLDMKHAHAASGRFLINLALILSLFIGSLRKVKLEDYVHNYYLGVSKLHITLWST